MKVMINNSSGMQRYFDAWGEIPFLEVTYPVKVSDDLFWSFYKKVSFTHQKIFTIAFRMPYSGWMPGAGAHFAPPLHATE